MIFSRDRILTTHVGSLPRNEKLSDLLMAQEEGKDYDPDEWVSPGSVAGTFLHLLDLPADATIPDITVRPRPR